MDDLFRNFPNKSQNPDLVIISGIKPIISEITALHENAQNNVDCLINWQGTARAFESIPEIYLRLLDDGVQFRMIMDVPPEKKVFEDTIKPLIEHHGCQIKYVHSVPAFLLIRDGKQVLMSTSTTNPIEASYLQIHNEALVSLIHGYYDLMWKTN